jgi:hypothetical protein
MTKAADCFVLIVGISYTTRVACKLNNKRTAAIALRLLIVTSRGAIAGWRLIVRMPPTSNAHHAPKSTASVFHDNVFPEVVRN